MNNIICFDTNYSSTKLLTKEKPGIVSKSEIAGPEVNLLYSLFLAFLAFFNTHNTTHNTRGQVLGINYFKFLQVIINKAVKSDSLFLFLVSILGKHTAIQTKSKK